MAVSLRAESQSVMEVTPGSFDDVRERALSWQEDRSYRWWFVRGTFYNEQHPVTVHPLCVVLGIL